MDDSDAIEQREELLQSIERDEEELRDAVHDLTGAARSRLDVGEWIREAPLAWLVGGVLLGVWLGTSVRRR